MYKYFIAYSFPNPYLSSFEKDIVINNTIIELEEEIKDKRTLNAATIKIVAENNIDCITICNTRIINFILLPS